MAARRTIVFDSWPVMAYLQGEPQLDRIIEIIADAHERGDHLAISVVNAGEIWYTIAQRGGPETADEAIETLQSLGFEFTEVTWETAQIAAGFKAKGGISYADCFAAAAAKQTNALLVTGDPEFNRVAGDISILWL